MQTPALHVILLHVGNAGLAVGCHPGTARFRGLGFLKDRRGGIGGMVENRVPLALPVRGLVDVATGGTDERG